MKDDHNCYLFVEAATYVGMMEIIDGILKSAAVSHVFTKKIGGGMITACFSGEIY